MNYKRIIALILVFALAFVPSVAFAETEIDIKVLEEIKSVETEKVELGEFANPLTIYLLTVKNGKQRVDDKLKEGIRVSKDRTAIGVRDFVDLIDGLEIFWNEEHRMVVIKSQDGKEIVLPIDRSVIFSKGVMSKIDVPATIDSSIGRTFLPMRTLATALGYEVTYDDNTHTASLKEPGYTPSIKDAVGEEVPTMQSMIDPVNEMFENENKQNQNQNVVDSILGNQPIKLRTEPRSVNTVNGSVTKEYVEDVERDLMKLINDYRVENGIKALDIDYNVKSLSDIRAAEFSSNTSNRHSRPDGSPWNTIGDVNGENSAVISIREDNAKVLFNAWKSSPGHDQNMLRREFNSFYISVISDGKNLYAVNLFKQ